MLTISEELVAEALTRIVKSRFLVDLGNLGQILLVELEITLQVGLDS